MVRKQNPKEMIASNRPPGSAGRLDQRLAGLALRLRGVVAETQRLFIYPACQLDNDALDELAVALIEFAEDIHAGIGLWRALENYQSEFFGTPLPLFLDVGESLSGSLTQTGPVFPLHSVGAIQGGPYSRPGPPGPYGTGGDGE